MTTFTKLPKSNLPDKPSDLLEVALRDLKAVEAMRDTYVVNMGLWHEPKSGYGSKCAVCLAGSVLAQSMSVHPTTSAGPSVMLNSCGEVASLHPKDAGKLLALNNFRMGLIGAALAEMKIPRPKDLPRAVQSEHAGYRRGEKKAFKEDMQGIIDLLRKHGL
jgi:hypothetical protein